MRGHEEASGTKYVPEDLMNSWAQKDPLQNFDRFLKDKKVLSESITQNYTEEIKTEINEHLKIAFNEEKIIPNLETELNDVYQDYQYQAVEPSANKKKHSICRCGFKRIKISDAKAF
jgi:2-oxoisovalerate dehydrogenase E1 component